MRNRGSEKPVKKSCPTHRKEEYEWGQKEREGLTDLARDGERFATRIQLAVLTWTRMSELRVS